MQTYPIATIDLAALKHNLKHLKQLASNSKVMSVIKANGYGHGAVEIARALEQSDAFAVARLSEAIQLRQAGIDKAIVLLEGIHSVEQLQQAAEYRLSPVFHHWSQINFLQHAQTVMPLQFCWLMIETGMHRLGISLDDSQQAYEELSNSALIEGDIGLMSHFANSDSIGDVRNQQQLQQILQVKSLYSTQLSMANSAAILSIEESHFDWVRPGLMLYGISPFEDKSASDLGFKPAMKFRAKIVSINDVHPSEQVGYGGDWQASEISKIGTVDVGYGDGYSRHLSNKGYVSIKGQKVSVVGRVSMDMICVDLSEMGDVDVGQEVILWGDEAVSVETVAALANTIPYELVCQLNGRVERQYING